MKLFCSFIVLLHRDGTVTRPVDEVHPTPSHPNIAKVSAAHSALIGPDGAEARRNVARALVMIDNEVRQAYEFPDLEAEAARTKKKREQKQQADRTREGAHIVAQETQLREQLADLARRKAKLGIVQPAPTPAKPAPAPAKPEKPPEKPPTTGDLKGAELSAKAAGETKPAETGEPTTPPAK